MKRRWDCGRFFKCLRIKGVFILITIYFRTGKQKNSDYTTTGTKETETEKEIK